MKGSGIECSHCGAKVPKQAAKAKIYVCECGKSGMAVKEFADLLSHVLSLAP